MQVQLQDYQNGRPITLKTSNQVAARINQLKPKRMYKEILALADSMPNTKEKYLIKANAELHLKLWKDLALTCDRGLDLQENCHFYNLKGKAVGKLGNFQEKVQLTLKAIEMDSSVPAFFRNLGAAHYKLKNYDAAIKAHEKAIALQPKHSINYHNKGAALFRLGEFEMAKQCLVKAIELDRKQVISYSWLGDCERQLGNFEKAKELYERAYDLSGQEIYKEEMKKMEEKIDPEKKKSLFYRIFG